MRPPEGQDEPLAITSDVRRGTPPLLDSLSLGDTAHFFATFFFAALVFGVWPFHRA